MDSDNKNPPPMHAEDFNDLSALFAAQDERFTRLDQTSDRFIHAVMDNVRESDRRRRSILGGFGMLGGLIAGAQFPSFLALFGKALPSPMETLSPSVTQVSIDNIVIWSAVIMFAIVMGFISLAEAN